MKVGILILSILITRPIRILYNILFSTIFKRSSNGVEQFGNDTFDFFVLRLSLVNQQRCADCWGMFCVHKDLDKLLPMFTANNWSRLRAQVAFYRGLTSLTLLCSTPGGILRGRLINITFNLTASSVFLFLECNQLICSRMSYYRVIKWDGVTRQGVFILCFFGMHIETYIFGAEWNG